jgi:hypothetical protein
VPLTWSVVSGSKRGMFGWKYSTTGRDSALARPGIVRSQLARLLIFDERRREYEAVAQPQLGSPQRRDHIVVPIERFQPGGS